MSTEDNVNEQTGFERLYGINEASRENYQKSQELLRELINSDAVITIISKSDTSTRTIIKHERDVANAADVFTQEREDINQEFPVAWMLPVEIEDEKAFVIISPDFTASVHFIENKMRNDFQRMYSDHYSPGRKQLVVDQNRIHTGGVWVEYEDKSLRLVPNNPDHIEKINEHLSTALDQARERVRSGIESEKQNRIQTLTTFANFYDDLTNSQSNE